MVVAIWVVLIIVTFLAAAGIVEYSLKRGRYRPLSKSFGPRPTQTSDLGSEEIDFDLVRGALRTNNMAGASGHSGSPGHLTGSPKPINDEAYARIWFQAYGTKPKGPSK